MPGLLIADDMPIIRRMVTRIATEERLHLTPVVEASNGVDALAIARQTHPDIIVMDIKMPVLDGLKAASLIRAEQPAVKIIMLTAHDDFAYAQQALRLGAVDYLLKPIRPANLREVLVKVHAQMHREQHKHQLEAAVGPQQPAAPPHSPEPAPPGGAPPAESKWQVSAALAYIRENMDRSDITLSEVAHHVNLSTSHLAYLLKENLGIGYSAYLTSLRLEQAKRLLRSTDFSIATIAEMVGYATVSNFYRLFRKDTNMTPAAYRQSVNDTDTTA